MEILIGLIIIIGCIYYASTANERWQNAPDTQKAAMSIFRQLEEEGWEGKDEGILSRATMRIRQEYNLGQEKARIACGQACERWRNTPDILNAANAIYHLLEEKKWNGKDEEALSRIRNQVQREHNLIQEKERLACFHATKRWEKKYGGGMSVYARD